ncbi:Glycine dehydrogenase (decarboxylating) [Chloroherpeton thalassium ATCC 35110]|uniref:Probable glycine dehydrogenase (decarboxylating) subunit 1 n=1 Tax=Chloroherpeton thalassium (strain ATCC 35110 / GB-78) TaxID=517418 RepID=GCSPA_CHLT3|nr:aminomethyl-transferring glycine dehydrogenase subunit GcvPA [Chloroherpeton thalassium]B3QUT6.1 RecName: Full=Probable glycine dehydrogenase (decarboxylating) subunit 1; AltName: Full=Glycine cleavage system P-protein subunit 1; AltName: Full=Glycine decarboxylase subunit 1; AltName: Full=Glycine dehydrogenase (aminomethyl-transferring) subunit 1 [Chloroherpeton thalassium ATCC 35110]ACF14437.1 Glycine dehydrogenase (decarboxylating) [Chloroherpeton thalassium ATCC 35110]
MPFIPNTDADRATMLQAVGASTFDDLISNIPEKVRFKGALNLPEALSEMEVLEELNALANANQDTQKVTSFLGGGAYDHFVPSAIGAIISRSEFYTAYTPYQAEVSQGTLQAMYEFQTMVARLTGMDVANASMYDGATALAEAMLLSVAHKNRKEVVLAGKINPNAVAIMQTYGHGQEIHIRQSALENGGADLASVRELVSDKTAAMIVQHPNFFGCLEDVHELQKIAAENNALFIVSADPISLGILEAPGNYGADIVVGEGQGLGNTQSFGGPYLGLFAAKSQLLRKIPGRLSGMTVDKDGNQGFILTLQTREQHIRREKATSNICTNQALNALCACIYMSMMGKEGLTQVASLSIQKAHYLANEIQKLDGFKLKFSRPFFKEFAIELPIPASQAIAKLLEKKIHAGVDLKMAEENGLLIAVTEKRSKAEMNSFVEALKELC